MRYKIIAFAILSTLAGVVGLCRTARAQNSAVDIPQNFDARREGVQYGSAVSFKYESPVSESERSANVLLPPGYNPEKAYPVLYLLHGIGGDENEWMGGAPNEILSNLRAENEASEMIVVIPNICVRHKSVATPPPFFSIEHFREFDAFLDDFQRALRPAIEKRYRIKPGRENHAVAGLSMGGREALYLGIKLVDFFGAIGAFEPAPGVLPYNAEPGLFKPEELRLPDEYRASTYLFVVKGDSDQVVGAWPKTYADALTNNGDDPHFTVLPGGHDFGVWRKSLYLFAKEIFKKDRKESNVESKDAARGDSETLFTGTRETILRANGVSEGKFQVEFANPNSSDDATLRCIVEERPGNPWNVGLRYVLDKPIRRGERLELSFNAKTINAQTESGLGVARPFFEFNRDPYDKSLFERVEIGLAEREYKFSFQSRSNYGPGECAFGVFLGDIAQSLEISAIKLVRGGRETATATEALYSGAEANAAWRREAEDRIEAIRKGRLRVNVRDADGNPLSDVELEIRQTRSAFQWGTCVVPRPLFDRSADGERYREFIEKYCNIVVFENDTKWFAWNNPRSRESVFRALDWLSERGIAVRGHCLVWPSWRNSNPQWRELENDPEKLRTAIYDHILDEAGALKGRVVDWDVVNEAYNNNDIWRILGKPELAEWFKKTREADPEVRLYINDFGILSGEGLDRRKQDFYYNTIRELIDSGAPIGGIGFQGHFGGRVTSPEKVIEIIDRFSELGLPVAITEHDVDTRDEALQAQYTRDFLTAAFSCPSVDKILLWGFWARSHWRPNAAYFRQDWSATPAGEAFMELVGEKWRSNLLERTNADGVYEGRVFLGEYEIAAKLGERGTQTRVDVGSDGQTIEIVLP